MVRLKHRYLVYQILTDNNNSFPSSSSRDINNLVRDKIQALYGDVGFGSFGISCHVKFFDPKYLICVIRVPREFENEVRFSIVTICVFNRVNVVMRILSVAGCERTCKSKLQELYNIMLTNSRNELVNDIPILQHYDMLLKDLEL
jgi:RNase P/RNase MRP subunit POP5